MAGREAYVWAAGAWDVMVGGLEAPGAFRWEGERLAELGEEDIEHEKGDKHADRRVENLLQILHFFVLLSLRFLNSHPAEQSVETGRN